MDGGAWYAAVHGVSKSQTRLSDFTFPFHFHALEKEMATHSSVLAWRIPGMDKPSVSGVAQSQTRLKRLSSSSGSSSSSSVFIKETNDIRQENGYASDLEMTSSWGERAEKESKGLVSPAGTASCFGYKGATLKITTVKYAEGLRSQCQEATTKS